MKDKTKTKNSLVAESRKVGKLVDELEKLKKERKEIEEKYRNMFEYANDAIITTTNKSIITSFNKKAEDLFGYNREDIIGKSASKLVPTKKRKGEKERFKSITFKNKSGIIGTIKEGIGLTKNGHAFPVEGSYYAFHANDEYIIAGIFRDISERKQMDEQLRSSEEKARVLLNAPPDIAMLIDNKATLIDCNEALCLRLHKSREELLGKTPLDLFDAHAAKRRVKYIKKLVSKGTNDHYQDIHEGRWYDISVHPIFDTQGKVAQAVVLAHDITEMKQKEEELVEAKDYLENLIESSSDSIVVSDTNGFITKVNRSFLKLVGYKADEVLGKMMVKFTPTEEGIYESTTGEFAKIDKQFFDKSAIMVSRFMNDGKMSNWESYLLTKNKKVIPVDITIAFLFKEGKRTGSIGILRDISERRKAEQTIVKTMNFLEDIIRDSADGIVVSDTLTTMTMVNEAAENILGYSKEDLLGKRTHAFIPQGEWEKRDKLVEKAIANKGSAYNYEHQWVRKDGRIIDLGLNIGTLKDSSENVIGLVACVRDITERKAMEKKLFEYHDQLRCLASQLINAEEKNQQNIAAFLHDNIGQDLFSLKIKLKMLQDAKSFKESKLYANTMLATIDQLIANARSLTSELSPPILHELGLGAALEWLAEQMHKREGIIVQFEDDGHSRSLEKTINILIFNVVRELFNNIVKHAKAHNVKISIQNDDTSIQVCIEDDGIGFKPEEVNSPMRDNNSFGLFSIKERLSYVGGHIEIQSKPSQGTRIAIKMPHKLRKSSSTENNL